MLISQYDGLWSRHKRTSCLQLVRVLEFSYQQDVQQLQIPSNDRGHFHHVTLWRAGPANLLFNNVALWSMIISVVHSISQCRFALDYSNEI